MNKKRALRIFDGENLFTVGFDVKTSFKVIFTDKGDSVTYRVEGGDSDKSERTLQGGELGPKEFLTDDQKKDFWAMQLFVKTAYGLEASKYTDVNTYFGKVKEHATFWDSTLYPKIVSVATDVVDYSRQAQSSIDGFLAAIELMKDPTQKAAALQGMKEMIADLITSATKNKTAADGVYSDLGTFSLTLATDVANGNTLYKHYADLIGTNSTEQESLRKRIEVLDIEITSLNEDYRRYCLIAETTPTYLVVPFVGWIAAAIVAGIYGDKAKKTCDQIEADEREKAAKKATLDEDAKEFTNLTAADSKLSDLVKKISAAQAAVDKYRGAWGAIAGDLQKNLDQLNSATPEHAFVFRYAQLGTLQKQWVALEKNADQFRLSAFVSFSEPH